MNTYNSKSSNKPNIATHDFDSPVKEMSGHKEEKNLFSLAWVGINRDQCPKSCLLYTNKVSGFYRE